jgi:hypothetical protein
MMLGMKEWREVKRLRWVCHAGTPCELGAVDGSLSLTMALRNVHTLDAVDEGEKEG